MLIYLLVPYRWNRGDFRVPRRLSLCPSVCPSDRPSVRPSVRLGVRPLGFSELFSFVLWHIDLKFGMWICLDIISFRHAWTTFTGVIALCWYLVFRTFLCRLLRYWLEIWYMNLSWHNSDQVWFCLAWRSFSGVFPSLLRHWIEISILNIFWLNNIQFELWELSDITVDCKVISLNSQLISRFYRLI